MMYVIRLFCVAVIGLLQGVVCLSSVPAVEVEALQSLYLTTNGEYWVYDVADHVVGSPWNFSLPAENTDPCVDRWFGITCTQAAEDCTMQTCHIEKLNLGAFNLQGDTIMI